MGDEVKAQIEEQGIKVRELKAAKSAKAVIDAEVKILLALKGKYKEVCISKLLSIMLCTIMYIFFDDY